MDGADRWARVERIYHEAVDLPVGERARFLDSACTGDAALRRELESLLARDGPSLLERSALDAAAMAIAQDAPPSWIGRTIHSYEIVELLGAGGMGEVYRARDKTLGRDVALKLLPYEMSGDAERLRRLEREARMLASLNDPRIATLYGLEEHDGQRFLVMELVPGQTLAERLRRGALPVRDALDICRQIAEGLEAAHDAGIIHRDLKPANVKLLPDGRVKLLDFGLAKALETPAMGEPTRPGTDATREGAIMGTPAYMSPEQARGQVVDRRTDIWAFGCCLYETLCGRAAFSGKTISDTLVAVLDREPDWGALPDRVPVRIRLLLQRCLTKDAHERLQHIGDARLELKGNDAERNASPVRRPWRMRSVIAGATLLLVAGATLGVELWRPRMAAPPGASVTRLTLKMEGEAAGNLRLQVNGFSVPFALSPDGARLVMRAKGANGSQLFLRELSGFETRLLPGTRTATTPVFSPDGRWIAFWRPEERMLKKVSIAGGLPIDIAPTDAVGFAIWAASDEIVIDTVRPSNCGPSRPTEARLEPSPFAIEPRGKKSSCAGLFPAGRTCSSRACALRRPGSRCSHERPGRGAGWCEAAATPSPASRVPASWSTRMPTRSSLCLSILSGFCPWVPRFRPSTGSTISTGMPTPLSRTAVRWPSCPQTASANPSSSGSIARGTSRRCPADGARLSAVRCLPTTRRQPASVSTGR